MRRIFITGGTGFFGKSMLDYRLRYPDWKGAQAEWIILSRAPEKFAKEYPQLANQAGISFVEGDVRDFVFPRGPFDAINIVLARNRLTYESGGHVLPSRPGKMGYVRLHKGRILC